MHVEHLVAEWQVDSKPGVEPFGNYLLRLALAHAGPEARRKEYDSGRSSQLGSSFWVGLGRSFALSGRVVAIGGRQGGQDMSHPWCHSSNCKGTTCHPWVSFVTDSTSELSHLQVAYIG